ncbi:glycerol-3-phosphate acyltransferase [Bacteroidia bacterium]|nr:glycerol-3-phosphate acyltransferase [Bacteroidia bacterium]
MSIALIIQLALYGIAAYLFGSIPTAVWVGKRFYNIDVREHGSRNAGSTNVLRVLGLKAALPVFIVDVLKGLAAVLLIYIVPNFDHDTESFNLTKIALGLLAVLGHMYPVFAGFRGGKGVATTLGIAIAIYPYGTLLALAAFVVVFVISKTVSVSSLTAGLVFPIVTIFVLNSPMWSIRIFAVLVCLLLFYTHRKNIGRLLKGTEPKTSFHKKSS